MTMSKLASVRCPRCLGRGRIGIFRKRTCPRCGGTGKVIMRKPVR